MDYIVSSYITAITALVVRKLDKISQSNTRVYHFLLKVCVGGNSGKVKQK